MEDQKEILEIANQIDQMSGTLYLVGGAVRDGFLGKTAGDQDYCVTGISQDTFEKMFSEAKKRGKSFPVYDLAGKEFALARREQKRGIGHTNFEIENDGFITIQEDLKRRDITINSMAQNVLTKEIIDPYHGREDLEKRVIRKVSDAFAEDPLRCYRVARFATSLGFIVEESTIQMMRNMKEELYSLPGERVWEELRKALQANNPSVFFEVLKQAELLEVHFKEIFDLIGSLQPIQYHPEGDAYNHTMQALDFAANLTGKEEVRFSVLVHDLGKGITPKEQYPHHYGHDRNGTKLVENMGSRLHIPNLWVTCGKVSTKWHMKAGIFSTLTSKKQLELIEQVDKTPLGLEGMKIVVMADKNREKGQNFDLIGKECLVSVTGKQIQESEKIEGKKLGERLHEKRIRWLTENRKRITS